MNTRSCNVGVAARQMLWLMSCDGWETQLNKNYDLLRLVCPACAVKKCGGASISLHLFCGDRRLMLGTTRLNSLFGLDARLGKCTTPICAVSIPH
jgi:hypothetical protein